MKGNSTEYQRNSNNMMGKTTLKGCILCYLLGYCPLLYLSTLTPRCESHTFETKTLISCQIMPADQFLMPDSQMCASKLYVNLIQFEKRIANVNHYLIPGIGLL